MVVTVERVEIEDNGGHIVRVLIPGRSTDLGQSLSDTMEKAARYSHEGVMVGSNANDDDVTEIRMSVGRELLFIDALRAAGCVIEQVG